MRVPRMYSSGAGAWLPLLALGVGWLMGVGCSPSAPTPAGAGKPPAPLPAAVLATNSYPAKGLVRSVDLSHRKVKITHENIPGYMPRMTMDFDVRDASNLAPLKPGDEVTFTVRATADDGWIEGLTVSAPAQAAASPSTNPPPAADRAVADSEPLFPGDPLPSIALTNELVRPVTFQQYRGQVVAFTFFFATCPFPTMCPRMSTNLRDAYRELKAQPSSPTNWHFFSITIDPATDTPEVLKQYAARYQYDPVHWSFLTGPVEDVERLGRHFGLQFFREAGALNHNLRTVVVGADGKVRRILIGNEWKVEELVTEVQSALAGKPVTPP